MQCAPGIPTCIIQVGRYPRSLPEPGDPRYNHYYYFRDLKDCISNMDKYLNKDIPNAKKRLQLSVIYSRKYATTEKKTAKNMVSWRLLSEVGSRRSLTPAAMATEP